jgi:hypothetical protein
MDRQIKEKTDRSTLTKIDDAWVVYTMLQLWWWWWWWWWWWCCQGLGKKGFYPEGRDRNIGMCHAAENCTVVLGNFFAGSGMFS